ncbi:MAG: hypothetical protein U9R14_04680 [Patescibacteria group bacterium]|nr:hypothetical protein [Patescibacteria group bacterium]
MQLYSNILKQGLKITWQNKYLWFFGLFAALFGNGGEYEILARGLSGNANFFPGWQRFVETGVFSSQTLNNIKQIIHEDPLSLAMILAVGLVIFILFGFLVWLVIVSQAALVNNSANIITEKKSGKLGIQNGVAVGIKNFWPVFGLNIVIKLFIYLLFILLSLPFVLSLAQNSMAAIDLFYVIAFIIFIPLAIALSFIIKYAIAYVVIRGSGFCAAIRDGWRLFAGNWLVSVEMAFILFFINLLVGLALVLTVLILAVPFLFLGLIFYYIFSATGFWVVAILALIIFLAITVLTGAALSTFQIASWTGLFIELINKGGTSRIARMFKKLEFRSKK